MIIVHPEFILVRELKMHNHAYVILSAWESNPAFARNDITELAYDKRADILAKNLKTVIRGHLSMTNFSTLGTSDEL
jgi:hypothetical protein